MNSIEPAPVNLRIYAGFTFDRAFQLWQDRKAQIKLDMTGWTAPTATFDGVGTYAGAPEIVFTPAEGVIELHLSQADTQAGMSNAPRPSQLGGLRHTSFRSTAWRLVVTDPDGVPQPLVSGEAIYGPPT